MKTKNPVNFILILLFAVSACKKDKQPSAPQSDVDIYVAGVSVTANDNSVATYWKNGVPVKLMDSTAGYSEATAIAIKGSDVYVAGFIGDNKGVFTAVYWKNGVITKLTDGLSSAKTYGIALQGNNVYVVGATFIGPTPQNPVRIPIATYWKNNVATQLPDKLQYVSEFPGCITVNGDDVYISGNRISADGKEVISYWKNEVITEVTDSTTNAFAAAMAVSGTDIYFAGNAKSETYRFGQAAYWKNGTKTTLLLNGSTSLVYQANAITIVGNDVYIAGTCLGNNGLLIAIYWKNGVVTALSLSGSTASAIVANGKDLYIAGSDSKGGVYWKNGEANYLAGGLHAYDIKVVPHQ